MQQQKQHDMSIIQPIHLNYAQVQEYLYINVIIAKAIHIYIIRNGNENAMQVQCNIVSCNGGLTYGFMITIVYK